MTKGIRVNEEGDASLEDYAIPGAEDAGESGPPEQATGTANGRKVFIPMIYVSWLVKWDFSFFIPQQLSFKP